MDRRNTLKALLLITAGTAFMPACIQSDKEVVVPGYDNLDISSDDEALVGEISEALIPKTDTPGAKDVNAHLFTLLMVNDCAAPEDQKKFGDGLKEFRDYSKKKLDQSFTDAMPEARSQFLTALENDKELPANVAHFYRSVKHYTLQGYTMSQYFMTKVQEYKLVPGKYYGCVPVDKTA